MLINIKNIRVDYPFDVYEFSKWVPSDIERFEAILEFEIGFSKNEHGELFQLAVCDYGSAADIRGKGFNKILRMSYYDSEYIISYVLEKIKLCESDNWYEFCLCVKQFLIWEYDGILQETG